MWIPDTQVRKGVETDHIEALGNYIAEKQPEKIIIAGDWWDFPSVSNWNSKLEKERLRLLDDIEAGNAAMARMWNQLKDGSGYVRGKRGNRKRYRPEVHFLHGNHEFRLTRFIQEHPELERLLGDHLLHIKRYKMIPHAFKEILSLDGIDYSHYFYMPKTGRPYSGMIETRLKNIGHSFTQGHDQEFAYGERQLPNGEIHHGLVAGAFYMHDETYKGPQGNAHWRGVVMKNEVRDGRYDIMKVSLRYLLERYL